MKTKEGAVIEYPSRDGEPMAETGQHVMLIVKAIQMLRTHFRGRKDHYIIGNIFLYYEEGNPLERRSPDLMVIEGVPSEPERDSFKIWEEGAVPCCVIEFTSKSSKDEDTGFKKRLYQRLGVKEYFLFDPFGDWLPRPLVGYRLIVREEPVAGNGELVREYEELPPGGNGEIPSSELGLVLVPNGASLAFFNPRTRERLPEPLDLAEKIDSLVGQLTVSNKKALDQEKELLAANKKFKEQEQDLLAADKKLKEQEKDLLAADKKLAAEAKKRLDAEAKIKEQGQNLEDLRTEMKRLRQQFGLDTPEDKPPSA